MKRVQNPFDWWMIRVEFLSRCHDWKPTKPSWVNVWDFANYGMTITRQANWKPTYTWHISHNSGPSFFLCITLMFGSCVNISDWVWSSSRSSKTARDSKARIKCWRGQNSMNLSDLPPYCKVCLLFCQQALSILIMERHHCKKNPIKSKIWQVNKTSH